MTKLSTFSGLTAFLIVLGAIGGHFNFEIKNPVTGQIVGTSMGTPNPVTFLDWIWNSIQFMYSLATFSVAGIPDIFNFLFLLVAAIWTILIILIIRGGE